MRDERIFFLRNGEIPKRPIIYWMSRDQRVQDNWALLYAQKLALEREVEFIVIFCVIPHFLEATLRHYDFMLKGLMEVQTQLHEKNIPFLLLQGDPVRVIPQYLKDIQAGLLVTDFDPLQIKQRWREKILCCIDIPFHEVDAHNIVPCRIVSKKQEFGAYTLRPKIHKVLDDYLDPFPPVKKHPYNHSCSPKTFDSKKVLKELSVNKNVTPVQWITSGEKAAKRMLSLFLKNQMNHYASDRNNPNGKGQSNLSPYLHFGQISAQRIVMETLSSNQDITDRDSFLEELIIRRELSDNFCFYNPYYDQTKGFPEWAKKTHAIHRQDKREYIYSLKIFEDATTHDPLWNAAQKEMVQTGKMHGYMRMYWAKKILEWTNTPEEALKFAIYLNDKYELDGRDPNGYTGIAWSIGGIHDRAWGERHVFGKIRYMNENGCKKKFHVTEYINTFN